MFSIKSTKASSTRTYITSSAKKYLSNDSGSWYVWLRFSQHQGRNEVRWGPGQEASLAPPFSILKNLGSKCTVLKKVLVTLLRLFGAPLWFGAPIVVRRPGNCATPCPPSWRPWPTLSKAVKTRKNVFSPASVKSLTDWVPHPGIVGNLGTVGSLGTVGNLGTVGSVSLLVKAEHLRCGWQSKKVSTA